MGATQKGILPKKALSYKQSYPTTIDNQTIA